MRFLVLLICGVAPLLACDDGGGEQAACEVALARLGVARSVLRQAEMKNFDAKETAKERRVEAAQARDSVTVEKNINTSEAQHRVARAIRELGPAAEELRLRRDALDKATAVHAAACSPK